MFQKQVDKQVVVVAGLTQILNFIKKKVGLSLNHRSGFDVCMGVSEGGSCGLRRCCASEETLYVCVMFVGVTWKGGWR